MKKNTFKTLLGGAALAGAMMFVPVSTFALDANAASTSSLHVGRDGIVKVINAEVTAISGNLISAITRFKDNVVSWAFTTNATTTVAANDTVGTSTAGISVGDRLAVAGTLSSIGASVINVNATAIKDITSTQNFRAKTGTVQSVNSANGTFTVKLKDDKVVTVQTNANTAWKGTVATLATLPLNAKVVITGTANADNTVITATQVAVKGDKKSDDTSSKGSKRDWDDNGRHSGFFKGSFGFNGGFNHR